MSIINPAELDLKEEAVVRINRVAKVTSRGKRFSFSTIVVVGDGMGHVGMGLGKANEVGVNNILTKRYGSSNPMNIVRATINALENLQDAVKIANKRGLKIKDVFT